MIDRYSSPVIDAIWSPEGRIKRFRIASFASARATAEEHSLEGDFVEACHNAITQVSLGEWADFEARHDHDVAGWVEAVRSHLDPEWHRWWHRGRTSSDIVDTAMGIGIDRTLDRLEESRFALVHQLAKFATAHRDAHVFGRTHGQPAEPTTIGRKFALFATQLATTDEPDYRVGKLSGPVGATPSGYQHEALVDIGLRAVPSTQVVPRIYLASVMTHLIEASAVLSQIAMEIRLGSQPEIGLYRETSPSRGARGSSAMPQKRNPIRSEQASGLTRLIRSNAMAVIEAGAELWNERDISHSSVERVAMVDAFLLLDYLYRSLAGVVSRLEVAAPDPLDRPTGASALEALLDSGVPYGEAYDRVRRDGPDVVAPDSRPRLYDWYHEPDLWDLVRIAVASRA